MTKIDQFESAFKSADKPTFVFEDIAIKKVAVISDLEEYALKTLSQKLQSWFGQLSFSGDLDWVLVDKTSCRTLGELLDFVEKERPDLILTYRNLHSGAWQWPYSLSEHLDVLTQVIHTPILVLPRPEIIEKSEGLFENLNVVMAVTDHLTGDHHLVSFASLFTEPTGTLFLTHIEDELYFERTIEIIGKISSIDTENAREEIQKKLLEEPHDYITSCRKVVGKHYPNLHIEEVIEMGHHLSEYKRLIEEHEVDLLVINTKDDDQLAMHGLAYPLAVELRNIPILML